MKKHILFIAVLCSVTYAYAQTIPFRLTTHNNIVMQVVINQNDSVNLMLHTGERDVTIIQQAIDKIPSVQFLGTVDSVSSWGGGNNTSEYSINHHVSVGGINCEGMTIWKDALSGPETDGKFGLNVFEKKYVAIDFETNTLNITDALPQKWKGYQKYALIQKNGLFFLAATCKVNKQLIEQQFMIHTGYAGAVLLDDAFANTHKLGGKIPIIGEKKLLDAFGNVVITKNGLLPQLNIGTFSLKDVPVGFFEGNVGRQTMSIIGGDIIKRFHWIIDADRQFVYLKRNKYFKSKHLIP